MPGRGTTRSGYGTALGTCEGVKYTSAHQSFEGAWLDEAMKTQSIAILQAPSGVRVPQAIGCGFQPHS